MDNQEEVFRGLVDAVFSHPSTKPHIPTSVREVQLEVELEAARKQHLRLLYRLLAIIEGHIEEEHLVNETDPSDDELF